MKPTLLATAWFGGGRMFKWIEQKANAMTTAISTAEADNLWWIGLTGRQIGHTHSEE